MSTPWITALVTVLALTGMARAQTWPGTPMRTGSEKEVGAKGLSLTDQGFVQAVADIFHAQAQLGSLAVDRGASPTVRQLAQQLVQKHHWLDFELTRLVEPMGLVVAPAKEPAQQPSYQRLQTLSGGDFDRAFLDQERRDLAEAAELFSTEATSGTDSSLRGFARTHVGELRDEMNRAAAERRRE
jgi:putative membrane protein